MRAYGSAHRVRRMLPSASLSSLLPTLRFLRQFVRPRAVGEREVLLPRSADGGEERSATVFMPAGRAQRA